MKPKLCQCIYKGGVACERQGGDGSRQHAVGYVHSFPTVEEVGVPVGGFSEALQRGLPSKVELALEDQFDDDFASAVFSLDFSSLVDTYDLVRKSLYDFDLDSSEGVGRLLALLPIMDPEIIKDVIQEIWPGYPVDEDFDPRIASFKVRGYLLDYLADNVPEEPTPPEQG